jgi:predicted permease
MAEESMSLVEQYIGRRWSLTFLIMLMVVLLVQMKEANLANTAMGFLAIIIGYFFRDIAEEKKA